MTISSTIASTISHTIYQRHGIPLCSGSASTTYHNARYALWGKQFPAVVSGGLRLHLEVTQQPLEGALIGGVVLREGPSRLISVSEHGLARGRGMSTVEPQTEKTTCASCGSEMARGARL